MKNLEFKLVRVGSATTENKAVESYRFVCEPEDHVKLSLVAEFEGSVPNHWAVALDGSIGDKITVELSPKGSRQSKLE